MSFNPSPASSNNRKHDVLRRILQGKMFSDFGNADEVDLDRGYHQAGARLSPMR